VSASGRAAVERTATGGGHVPFLDGVRGLAILLVILIHASFGARPHGVLDKGYLAVAHLGWCGVDLFFVLSGFLITGILWDTRRAENYLSSFYMRRLLRIVPVYYLCLAALTVLLLAVRPAHADTLARIPWHWAYLSNLTLARDGWDPLIAHFWSLSIEEQFYLVWPWCVLLLPLRGAMAGCVVGIVVALVSRFEFHAAAAERWAYAMPFARMDALLCGALVALAMRSDIPAPRLARACLACAATAAAAVAGVIAWQRSPAWEGTPMLTVGLSLVAVAFAGGIGALACGSGAAVARAMSVPVLRSIGRYSYAMYILHWPLHVVAQRLGVGPNLFAERWWSFACYAALLAVAAWACGWVSWRLWERPFLSLKGRFEARLAPGGDSGERRAAG
jgi:peptidoglycan/LPS O-acetylase OafA/YrhL